ncbi:MAG: ABC transporter ATP-binding protein, partial [Clostridia bacterium]|nr:ABC transporter ATP-binding protein [Clostridia bacterium]
ELAASSKRAIFASSLTNPATRFVGSVIYAAVGLAGALTVIGGALTVGGLTCFLSYAGQYAKPFNEISAVISEIQGSIASASRIFELIDEEEEPAAGNTMMRPARGDVSFDDVSFSYDKDKELLKSISFDVKAGQKIAIVGPTGCGKTTLINLFMRFYDPDSGKIYLDGVDTSSVSKESLRENIGMVLQDTFLFEATVLENITVGADGATREDAISAAKLSKAHSFIKRLPAGYDTVLTGGGAELSEGERQLLSITRVMLSRPSVLILDEATSSVDTRTEAIINAAFERLMEGKTSFIVAHRISTVKNADLILVMNDGKIIEAGRHGELMAKGGFYSTLYKSQFEA